MSDFIIDDEVKTIGLELVEKFPDQLGYIEVDKLLFVREISKSNKKAVGSCKAVKPPYNLLDPNIVYIVVVNFKANCDTLLPPQRSLLVLHQLLHIDPEFDGKLLSHDASDWAFIIDNFGTDYLQNNELPNILESEIIKKEVVEE